MDQIERARDLARLLLAESIPRRWSHSQGVGRKAESIAHLFGDDAPALVAAAWLHDIGYAPGLVVTGMHQLDGARYLRDASHADDLVCRLVANHSCAYIEARNRDLGDQFAAEFKPIEGLLSDALTYADMTTTPDGEPVEVEQRLAEVASRYKPDHVVARTMREAGPLVIRSVRLVEATLAED